jgi:hypothetical protein
MWKAQIKPGTEYALREKRDAPIQRVRIIEYVRGNRWKAEWIDPDPGLVHYVESGHLFAPWKEHKAVLKEEAARESLRQHSEQTGYRKDSPVDRALYEVFENVGDEVSYYNGVLSGEREAFERVKTRAGMDVNKQSPYAYVERSGTIHLPFDEALELARKFCAAEPAAVLVAIEATERKWAQDAGRPGEEHLVSLLNEYRATWALIRQWAGLDAAIAEREAQIQKLERLVWDAVYALQKAGLDDQAARLRRSLERR